MSGVSTSVVKAQVQRRGSKVVEAIFNATVAEIVRRGYEKFSVDAVARRAKVNKTTIYRRWAKKESLVLAALTERGSGIFEIPDTGSLTEDLVLVATRLNDFIRTPEGRALYLTLVQHGRGEGSVALPSESRRQILAIVSRAVSRGELTPEPTADFFVTVLLGAVMQWGLLDAKPVTENRIRRLVELLLAGNAAIRSKQGS
jgi:AcrR family transcriptional regulator